MVDGVRGKRIEVAKGGVSPVFSASRNGRGGRVSPFFSHCLSRYDYPVYLPSLASPPNHPTTTTL